jgi:hypothetical protein
MATKSRSAKPAKKLTAGKKLEKKQTLTVGSAAMLRRGPLS